MDTTNLKRFATEARKIIKHGVEQKLLSLGFNAAGEPSVFPRLLQGSTLFGEHQLPESFYYQWTALYEDIQAKGVKDVYEEAAYTWFNRLMAIRILQKNGFIDRVLSFDREGIRVPHIVLEARQGRLPAMSTEERLRLRNIIGDASKTFEQFSILIIAFCHTTPLIHKCFGGVNDYTELLLPDDILDEDGFIDLLNHTDFIKDEDYKSSELIGWLYQFYITERKDEVFAKKGKFEADEIPAATQIFTPNWIVKYMVQNTVGRIFLDNHPSAAEKFKPQWKYLVEPSEPTPEEAIYHYSKLEDLKVADLACGSGHILNECFDLLYDLYIYDGADRDEAVECIFQHNLTGIDLDRRAYQMAKFSLLIKACQKDNRFVDGRCMPNVLTMPEKQESHPASSLAETLQHVTLGASTPQMVEELEQCYELMEDADSLGSIMKFKINEDTRLMLKQVVEKWNKESVVPPAIAKEMSRFKLILALTEKYSALVMNPPYMGSGNMNEVLSDYVKKNYVEGRADIFSVFMLLAIERLCTKGKYGMINMQSWMFLPSFQQLRLLLLEHTRIDNLIHLGPHTFDELGGEIVQNVSFVLTNFELCNKEGFYFRLVDGANCSEKEKLFCFAQNNRNGNIYFPFINQDKYKAIPGNRIGYWISETMMSTFSEQKLGTLAPPRRTIQCGDVNRFIRNWFEVSVLKMECNEAKDYNFKASTKTWFRFSNGGNFRKWYGNLNEVLYWKNNGSVVKDSGKAIIPNESLYFKESVGYNRIASKEKGLSARLYYSGILLGDATSMITPSVSNYFILGLLNSKVPNKFMYLFNPSLAAQTGSLSEIPIIHEVQQKVVNIVRDNVYISKDNWDTYETSWDFKRPEILSIDNETYVDNIQWQVDEHFKKTGEHICIDPAAPEYDKLEWCYKQYCAKWKRLFIQLHDNEEELNQQFIDIYGLQDELDKYVPYEDITILQQGELTFDYDDVDSTIFEWHADVVMKQLISYAIGCMMGRYRLDRPGLHIAHPNPTEEELQSYTYHDATFEIDDDGIIPLMGEDSPFNDNASTRLKEFIKIAFGPDRLSENLNFLEKSLGENMTIAKYLQKEFWKYHKKMYQKRPIYWLFSSKKGAFQVIAYMHRMDAFTVSKIRTKYLLKQIEYLKQRIEDLRLRQAELSGMERRQLKNFEKDLAECQEYDIRLHNVANQQIAFDLDDGVVVNYAKFGDILGKI